MLPYFVCAFVCALVCIIFFDVSKNKQGSSFFWVNSLLC
jgi:hypothetical protein